MEAILIGLGAGILVYVGMMLLFPSLSEEKTRYTRETLEQIYVETQAAQDGNKTILKGSLGDEKPLIRAIYSFGPMRSLYDALLKAGYQYKAAVIIFTLAAITLMLMGVLAKLINIVVAIFLAPVIAYFILKKFFLGKVKSRNAKFLNLFPDVLDMIVRSVRSGFPVNSALQMVADNMEDPVKTEFKQVTDEISMGRTMNEALKRLAERISEPDIHFFVVVLAVQQETGGNLSEVIGNLSKVIRSRKQLRLKIRSMTSEGRTTAWILGLLPVFVFGVLYVIRKEYLEI